MSYKYDVERAVENNEFSQRGEFVDDDGFTWFYKLRSSDSKVILCAEDIQHIQGRQGHCRDYVSVKPGVRPIPQDVLSLPSAVNGYEVLGIDADAFRGAGSYLPYGDTRLHKWPPLPYFTQVKIPSSVKYIGARSFEGCDRIEKLSILNAEVIDCCAFMGCEKLKKVTFAEIGTKAIRFMAFSGCKELRGGLLLPDSLVTIEAGAFSSCYQIDHIHIPDGICEIMGNPFENTTCLISYPEKLGISTAINKRWEMRTNNPVKRALFKIANW